MKNPALKTKQRKPSPGRRVLKRQQSSIRNVFGSAWAASTSHTDLNVYLRSGDKLIEGNTKFFAVPYAGGARAAMLVRPLAEAGRLPEAPPLMEGHAGDINCFKFNPLNEHQLATGSRDSTVKIWKIPEEGVTELIKGADITLAHEKRITALEWNPVASSLLAASDLTGTVKIWDTLGEKEHFTLSSEVLHDMNWSIDGALLATSARDKRLRVLDPRTSKVLHEVEASESTKAFFVQWLGSDRVLTSSFDKQSQRLFKIWDLKNLSSALATHVVDRSGSFLYPFYDPGTNMVYFGGKGLSMYFYEMTFAKPYYTHVNTYKTRSTQLSITMLPKRVCDVDKCEIARFLRLTTDNVVETVSFTVPRKAEFFQEDLYPPMPSGEAALSTAEWLEGKTSLPKMKSCKPEDKVSVYDISLEEGGKKRVHSEETPAAGVVATKEVREFTGGELKLESVGWIYNTWYLRYVTLKRTQAFVFENQLAPKPVHTITFTEISEVMVDPKDDKCFYVKMKTNKPKEGFHFQTSSAADCKDWMYSFTNAISAEEKVIASAMKEVSAVTSQRDVLVGKLEILGTNFLGRVRWASKWCTLEGNIIKISKAPNQEPETSIHLDKIVSVHTNKELSTDTRFAFQVASPGETFTFGADTLPKRAEWVKALSAIRDALVSEAEHHLLVDGVVPIKDSSGETVRVDGFLKYWSSFRWLNTWVTLIGDDLCNFSNVTSKTPWKRISLREAKQIIPSSGKAQCGFEIVCKKATHYYQTPSTDERDEWVEKLTTICKASVDLFKVLDLSSVPASDKNTPASVFVTKVVRVQKEYHLLDLTQLRKGQEIPLLIQIKGKRLVSLALVEPTWKSLKSDRVFVLDLGLTLYIWNGKAASRVCKAKGFDVCNHIRMKDRSANAKVFNMTQDEDDFEYLFWKALGSDKLPVVDSLSPEEQEDSIVSLYRVGQEARLIHQGVRYAHKDVLESSFSYVLSTENEIFVWIGKDSKVQHRKEAVRLAKGLAIDNSSHSFPTVITQLYEEGEVVLFKERFYGFPGMLPIAMKARKVAGRVAVTKEQHLIDVKRLLESEASEASNSFDEGKGKLQHWIVYDFEKVKLTSSLGLFFSTESYLFLYTYSTGGRILNLIYFWQGRDCPVKDKGTSAYLTKQLNEEMDGNCQAQLRVVQQKETQHFRSMFSGNEKALVIRDGKHRILSGEEVELFDVAAASAESQQLYAVQVKLSATCLSSLRCFVLCTPHRVFLWTGSAAPPAWQAPALQLARRLANQEEKKKEVEELKEGKESSAFWEALGGKKLYFQYSPSVAAAKRRPRLFRTINSGVVDFEELHQPCQDDLEDARVCFLDTVDKIYVWISAHAASVEKKVALQTVERYAKESKSHSKSVVLVCKQYHEPDEFKHFFQAWSDSRVPKEKRELTPAFVSLEEALLIYNRKEYSYEELLSDPLPEGVDPTTLEIYLSDEEFEEVFKMTRAEWTKVPAWKKTNLKKEVYLY